MSDIAQQDIAYQPATKAYAFSTNPSAPDNSKLPRKPMSWKPFFLFLGVIASLTLVFIIFLGVLNYFRIVSLSADYPKQLGALPQVTAPSYNPEAHSWTMIGTFSQYDNEKIKIKTGPFSAMDFVYRVDSLLMKSDLPVDKTQTSDLQAGTLFDLDQQTNLGKTVKIEYITESKVNYIYMITLYGNL